MTSSQMNQMSRINNCTILSGWGRRPVDAAGGAALLRATFWLLDQIGGALACPWGYGTGDSRETARIIDVSAMNDQELTGFVSTAINPEYPESGFHKTLFRGQVITDEGWGRQDFAGMTFALNTKIFYDAFALFGDEYRVGASDTMRRHAVELITGLSRIWRPDSMSLQDRTLGTLEDKYFRAHDMGPYSWTSWGYVSYLSDRVVSDLESNVKGASVTRFGTGWILVSDKQNPVATAKVWRRLHDRGCLRHMPLVQDWEPQFPDESE